MQRKRLVWKLRESELVFAEQTLVAGLVPVIPALAPDGQQYDDAKRAYARAMMLEEQGAAFIVLGAESLAPGKTLLTAEEQIRRIMPVLKSSAAKSASPSPWPPRAPKPPSAPWKLGPKSSSTPAPPALNPP